MMITPLRTQTSSRARFAFVVLFTALFFVMGAAAAVAQTTQSDLRQAAEKIAAMQKEAQYQQEHGQGVEAIRLREEAKKLWNTTVGHIALEVDRKQKAEEEMTRIAKEERRDQAIKEVEVGVDAWKSVKAGADWLTECAKGPEVCLVNMSKAKTAIEKGFEAAGEQVEANVHADAASYADGIRARKEDERNDLEKSRASMDRLNDWIDYSKDAASHQQVQPSVPIGGEFRDPNDPPAKPTSADYDAALDALSAQGSDARAANATAGGTVNPGPDFASDFAKTASAEEQKVAAARRDVESQAKTADAIKLPVAPVIAYPTTLDSKTYAVGGTASGSAPAADAPKQSDAKKVDHCPGGVFHCPNGLPWEKCGHAEKYDCPPPEHAAEAAAAKAKQQKDAKKP